MSSTPSVKLCTTPRSPSSPCRRRDWPSRPRPTVVRCATRSSTAPCRDTRRNSCRHCPEPTARSPTATSGTSGWSTSLGSELPGRASSRRDSRADGLPTRSTACQPDGRVKMHVGRLPKGRADVPRRGRNSPNPRRALRKSLSSLGPSRSHLGPTPRCASLNFRASARRAFRKTLALPSPTTRSRRTRWWPFTETGGSRRPGRVGLGGGLHAGEFPTLPDTPGRASSREIRRPARALPDRRVFQLTLPIRSGFLGRPASHVVGGVSITPPRCWGDTGRSQRSRARSSPRRSSRWADAVILTSTSAKAVRPWSGRQDSNLRPHAPKARALPS